MGEIATHEPAPGSDFLIRVDLKDHGMPGRVEQLWVKQLGPTSFSLRSLPFFAYGLRLDDELETDETFTVQRVTSPSGRQLLRVAATRDHAFDVHDELHPLLEWLSLRHEWHGTGYVSIDLASETIPPELRPVLEVGADNGRLHFELA